MTHDRNYYRMLDDCELTHYAKEHGTTELEFVLLERLCTLLDVDEQLEAAQVTIEDLQTLLNEATDQLEDIHAAVCGGG